MRAHVVVHAALAIVCLILPVHVRAQTSAAIPAVTGTAGHADFLDEGRLGHSTFGGGLEWVLTRHIAVGPEILYMRGPGDDRDMFLVGVARFGILPLRSRVAPFVTAGGGWMIHSDDYAGMSYSSTEGAFILGGGVRINATSHVFIAPEFTIGWEPHMRYSVTVGIRFP